MGYDAHNPVHVALRKDALARNLRETGNKYGYWDAVKQKWSNPSCSKQGVASTPTDPHDYKKSPPAPALVNPAQGASGAVRLEVASPSVRLLPMALPSLWEALPAVGALRSFSIASGGPKGFKVTLKLDHATRGKVYRYGYVSSPEEAEAVASLWLRDTYWTPDKY